MNKGPLQLNPSTQPIQEPETVITPNRNLGDAHRHIPLLKLPYCPGLKTGHALSDTELQLKLFLIHIPLDQVFLS